MFLMIAPCPFYYLTGNIKLYSPTEFLVHSRYKKLMHYIFKPWEDWEWYERPGMWYILLYFKMHNRVIPARWLNRKPQILLSPQRTQLTNCLCEKSRSQLRAAPQVNLKPATWKLSRKIHGTHSPAPLPLTLRENIKTKFPCPNFSLGREKEGWNLHSTFWLLGELPQGLVSVLPEIKHW